MTTWKIESVSPTVHRLIFNKPPNGRDWKASILLMSDEHWDNAHCNLKLLKADHEEAVRRGAPIFKFGDTLCLMQGKFDKRSDMNAFRPEHRGNNYLDRVEETAAEWYAPYAKNIALITEGNHEASISARHQTNMLDRLVTNIKARTGVKIHKGGFTGFVIVGVSEPNTDRMMDNFVIHYHHGYGGGGEVTRGMIDNNRTRSQYQADVYYSGHIHRRNMDENTMISVTPSGLIEQRQQFFLRGSSYKDEFDSGKTGWHVMTGKAGRPMGGWWLNIEMKNHKIRYTPELT